MTLRHWLGRLAACGALLCAALFSYADRSSPAQADNRQGYRGGHQDALGERYEASDRADQRRPRQPRAAVTLRWNSIAIDASGLDHTPVPVGDARVFGEQLGPARSSRAMAIVHIAMFDAANAITRRYRGYTNVPPAAPNTNADAAIATAAHDTLSALFPSQRAQFAAALAEDLAAIRDNAARARGVALGRRAATTILAQRASDGSLHPEPRLGTTFIPSNDPGKWRQDPISQIPIALGADWPAVTPFAMRSATQFRLPPPPALGSAAYARDYNEVFALGGDGLVAPTQRTADQTFIGIFWAYDGTPSLCAPPRLYNQVAVQIAQQKHTQGLELLRVLTLVNIAMADTGIAAWDSKFHYQVWRPVTGIRESDIGTGPSGLGDGNAATQGDPNFSPLGAPASNLNGPNFTPPFPAYPSGHAAFGGALFQTLRRFYGHDNIPFTFVSDEYNGITLDNQGNVRPYHPRSYRSLTQAEVENAVSRIYLGIHWRFDATSGIRQGRQVANHVFDRLLKGRND